MQYNIRDKWLAICVFRNPIDNVENCNVTGNTKWKICGSKNVASKYVNLWCRERDSVGEFPLIDRIIQCKQIGRLIKDYDMWSGKDAQRMVKQLTGVANEMVGMASELGVKF